MMQSQLAEEVHRAWSMAFPSPCLSPSRRWACGRCRFFRS